MQPLTEDMIRVTNASIGANGKVIRDRPFHVWVGHHGVKDVRGRLRRFGRRGTAIDAARAFIAKHNQTLLPGQRWTREGRMLLYDGAPAIGVSRLCDASSNAKLSPVACDAIADYVCGMLNTVDVDALTGEWMRRP